MNWKAALPRLLISLAVGLLLGALISELSFRLLNNVSARPPQRVELVIPAGTAERVARGESNPALPEDMNFVVGDTLAVINQDSAAHTLGPLFIPAGATATLALKEPASLAYSCSFQPTNYLGLDVREPLTLTTRLQGILNAGLPLGVLLGIYSLVAWPFGAKRTRASRKSAHAR